MRRRGLALADLGLRWVGAVCVASAQWGLQWHPLTTGHPTLRAALFGSLDLALRLNARVIGWRYRILDQEVLVGRR